MRLILYFMSALVAVAFLSVALLVYTGRIAAPWATPIARAAASQPAGTVAVPLSVRRMPIYARVTRDDLLDPDTAKPVVKYLHVDDMATPPFTKPSDILGRVLRHPKEPGYTFSENDFFPKGTVAGMAAGVPVGKRALTLDASQISGVRDLAAGDHVDLVGTQTIDSEKSRVTAQSPGLFAGEGTKFAHVQTLARDAVVVSPITVRQVPYMSGATLNSPAQTRTKPVEEVTIAVDPGEIALVQQAMGIGSTLACVVHSGQPSTSAAAAGASDRSSDEESARRYAVVEQIVGDKHTVRLVPTTQALSAGIAPADGEAQP